MGRAVRVGCEATVAIRRCDESQCVVSSSGCHVADAALPRLTPCAQRARTAVLMWLWSCLGVVRMMP